MTDWDGHRAATRSALISLLTSAHTGKTKFSQSQRALFTACEFWAASRNHTLLSQFGDTDLDPKLHAAELSFALIGLPKTASVLMRARARLASDSSMSAKRILGGIERDILEVDELIDQTLEQFAKSNLREE